MRRTLLAAVAALSLLTGGCSDPDEPEPPDAGGGTTMAAPSAPADDFTPPAGTRWVGVEGVALAVPERWSVGRGPVCGRPIGGVVEITVDFAGTIDCFEYGTNGVSHISLDPGGVDPPTHRPCDQDNAIAAVTVEVCGVRCGPAADSPCRLPFFIGELNDGVSGTVVTYGKDRRKVALGLLHTVTPVPDGFTIVPPLGFGMRRSEVAQLFERADLEPEFQPPMSRMPPGVTEPELGTVVPAGSTVVVVSR